MLVEKLLNIILYFKRLNITILYRPIGFANQCTVDSARGVANCKIKKSTEKRVFKIFYFYIPEALSILIPWYSTDVCRKYLKQNNQQKGGGEYFGGRENLKFSGARENLDTVLFVLSSPPSPPIQSFPLVKSHF